jgi:protease I
MKALIISANEFEDTELLVPYYRLREEGINVDIASLKKGKIRGKHGYEIDANHGVDEIDPATYDVLVLPGGKAPATLRMNATVLDVVTHFFQEEKPVAAICHGPQILAAAGVIKDRDLTCYPQVAPEVQEAGANYHDEEVVVDDNLVTSRMPPDLPAFMREFMKLLK